MSRELDITKSTLPSRRFENLLPGNPRKICSCRYRLEGHQLRFDPHCHRLAYIVRTWAGLLMSTNWKDTSYNLIFVIIGQLIKIIHYKPLQIPIDARRLPQLDCQQLRLSPYLQVLVPAVSLPSSTAVSTYASSTRTSNKNLMTACLARAWHSKSLSAGLLELRAWIWLLIKLIPAWVSYVWQISLCRTLWGFEHRFGHQPEGLIAPLTHYKPLKPRGYAPDNNIYSWYLHVTARAGPPERGGCTRTLRDIQRRKYFGTVQFSQWSQKPTVSRRSVSLVWQQKYQGACIGSSTLLKIEQHLTSTTFWYLQLTMALQRGSASGHPQQSTPTMAWLMTEPTPSAYPS